MSKTRLFLLIGFSVTTLCLNVNAFGGLTLSVHPFKPPTQLVESFTPLVSYLSEKLGGIPVSLRIATDYQAHIDAIGHDEVDMAYMGPAAYVKLVEVYGVKPVLARQAINGSPFFQGKIFVLKNSTIASLTDLKGKRFAFTEPLSTMGYLLPRSMLLHAGITIDALASFNFIGDHINVALAVLSGQFDVGAVKEDVYFNYEAHGLRAIATTPAISDHTFVVSNNMASDQVQQLRNILFNLHETPAGQNIMSGITNNVTAFVPAIDADFDSLRVLLRELKTAGVTY